jgi:ribonuclease-3
MSNDDAPPPPPGRDHRTDLEPLQEALDYDFDDLQWLERALTHRSHRTEHEAVESDNQRMEFLGDAVLGHAVADALFRRDREVDEGVLSKRQSQLVRKSTLARIARELDLGDYLRLGKGEAMTGGRNRPSLLADAYEAVLAAIYLDSNFEAAKRVVHELHADDFEAATEQLRPGDYKSRLQEWTQQHLEIQPEYAIVDESGPPHDRTFTARVRLDQEDYGRGRGATKQEAEQRAAAEALERLEDEYVDVAP